VFDDMASTIRAHLVIGCHLTREMRVRNAFDNVVSTIDQSVPTHVILGEAADGDLLTQLRRYRLGVALQVDIKSKVRNKFVISPRAVNTLTSGQT